MNIWFFISTKNTGTQRFLVHFGTKNVGITGTPGTKTLQVTVAFSEIFYDVCYETKRTGSIKMCSFISFCRFKKRIGNRYFSLLAWLFWKQVRTLQCSAVHYWVEVQPLELIPFVRSWLAVIIGGKQQNPFINTITHEICFWIEGEAQNSSYRRCFFRGFSLSSPSVSHPSFPLFTDSHAYLHETSCLYAMLPMMVDTQNHTRTVAMVIDMAHSPTNGKARHSSGERRPLVAFAAYDEHHQTKELISVLEEIQNAEPFRSHVLCIGTRKVVGGCRLRKKTTDLQA